MTIAATVLPEPAYVTIASYIPGKKMEIKKNEKIVLIICWSKSATINTKISVDHARCTANVFFLSIFSIFFLFFLFFYLFFLFFYFFILFIPKWSAR